MFIPNNSARHWTASEALNVRAERTYEGPFILPCAIVTLNLEVGKTSVRADSSGSRGRAEEEQGSARILFPAYVRLSEKDLIEVEGELLEIVQVAPRRAVVGSIDHYECDLRKSEAAV